MAKSKNRSSKAQRKEEARHKQSRPLKAAPPCAARDAVSATPELLEIVLSFFSLQDLLVSAQLVCTLWRDVVAHSSRLQRHLFFQPEQDGAKETGWVAGAEGTAYTNPLLRRVFGPIFFPGDHRCSALTVLEDFKTLPLADMRQGRKRHQAFTRAGASWRSMLVSQPPPRELALIQWKLTADGATRLGPTVARIQGPLRMGQLYDVVCRRAVDGKFRVAWGVEPEAILHRSSPWNIWDPYGPGVDGQALPASRRRQVVILGDYPRDLSDEPRHPSSQWDVAGRQAIIKRIQRDGSHWMFLCEEYDAKAVERLVEEAEEKSRNMVLY